MRSCRLGLWVLALLSLNAADISPSQIVLQPQTNETIPPLYKPTIKWDSYSLVINDQRFFLWSGEFHPWRLPVPRLWADVLQKFKASGMNTVSIYVHWGLTNPAPGVFDFDDYRALDPLFDMAMSIGLFIVLRPGPYINAETTAGGIPHWVTSTVTSHLRTNGTSYHDAWKPYIERIAEIAKPWQITNGGPIIAVQIENEYVDRDDVGFPGKKEMMEDLKNVLVDGGIDVPLTINDAYMGSNYVNGTGAGDIYGFDSYPQAFDCENPDIWRPVVTDYWDFHQHANPHQPLYIPEFQGGAYDAWGPGAPGYSSCAKLTGAAFASVFNLNLWANNAKMINVYMMYGGTSWGHLPFPGVYTSYDYGAAISENRDTSSDKYAEFKRQGLFLRSVPDFYKTDIVGNSSHPSNDPVVQIDDSRAFGTLLRNPDTGVSFYIVRQADSTSKENVTFRLRLNSREDRPPIQIPKSVTGISLNGRRSKVIVSDLYSPSQILERKRHSDESLGSQSARSKPWLIYSTAQLFFLGTMGGRNVIVLIGDSDQEYEFAMVLGGNIGSLSQQHPSLVSGSSSILGENVTIVNVLPGFQGVLPVFESNQELVVFADTKSTDTLFAPILETTDYSTTEVPFENFWSIGTNASIIIGGPALVRSASYSVKHRRLDISGDLSMKEETFLTVLGAPPGTRSFTWNGREIDPMLQWQTNSSIFHFTFPRSPVIMDASQYQPPQLIDWEYVDALPEIAEDFDDSDWTDANHTTTNLPFKSILGRHVLYGCDYGFCEGVVIWRGHFTGSGNETGARLIINGGEAFAASVFLNDVFLRTTYGNSTNNRNIVAETDEEYELPPSAIRKGRDNVITIVQDNMGLDETWNHWGTDGSRSPRGIRGYELYGGNFSAWKVQGKLGGYARYPDKTRGIFNEGGLFAERCGWHLDPDEIDDQRISDRCQSVRWTRRDPQSGLPLKSNSHGSSSSPILSNAGVGAFRTNFSLAHPLEMDLMISFNFLDQDMNGSYANGSPYRAFLFVNGWMMGRRIGNLGPQTKFPVHDGILRQGDNTIVLILWALERDEPSRTKLYLTVDQAYERDAEAF